MCLPGGARARFSLCPHAGDDEEDQEEDQEEEDEAESQPGSLSRCARVPMACAAPAPAASKKTETPKKTKTAKKAAAVKQGMFVFCTFPLFVHGAPAEPEAKQDDTDTDLTMETKETAAGCLSALSACYPNMSFAEASAPQEKKGKKERKGGLIARAACVLHCALGRLAI